MTHQFLFLHHFYVTCCHSAYTCHSCFTPLLYSLEMEISISTPTLHHENTQPHRAFITRDLRKKNRFSPPFLYYPFFERMFVCNKIRSLSLFLSPCALYISVFFCFFDRTCFECSFILFFEYIRYSTISFSLCRWGLVHYTERTHTRFETIVVSSSESSVINYNPYPRGLLPRSHVYSLRFSCQNQMHITS